MDIRRIEDALSSHSCTEALAWCSENKNALRKLKVLVSCQTHPRILMSHQSTLEFDLRLQEYIELARERRTTDAIVYSKKHLIPWQETHLMQIQQGSALLAFPQTTTCNPYKVRVLNKTDIVGFFIPQPSDCTTRAVGQTSFNLSGWQFLASIPCLLSPYCISLCTVVYHH